MDIELDTRERTNTIAPIYYMQETIMFELGCELTTARNVHPTTALAFASTETLKKKNKGPIGTIPS